MKPVCYVIAGANGVGKSTAAFQLVPAGVEQLNPDDIARQIRQSQLPQEVVLQMTNDEVQRRIREHVQHRKSFAVETNLHEAATWQYFLAFQSIGYRLELIFISTSDLSILYERVINRHLQGGHFVRQDVIRGRYESGLTLLNYFFNKPDTLTLIDSSDRLEIVYQRVDDIISIQAENVPNWVKDNFLTYFETIAPTTTQPSSPASIDEVRAQYNQLKQSSTDKSQ